MVKKSKNKIKPKTRIEKSNGEPKWIGEFKSQCLPNEKISSKEFDLIRSYFNAKSFLGALDQVAVALKLCGSNIGLFFGFYYRVGDYVVPVVKLRLG